MPANSKPLSNLKEGNTYSEDWTVTLDDINTFSKLSRDFNPIHVDKKYAQKFGFKKQVVHGFLTAAQFSRLLGMHLPGKNCLILEELISFPAPIYPGDKIRLEVMINSINEATETIDMKIHAKKLIENGKINTTVARGKILCKALKS